MIAPDSQRLFGSFDEQFEDLKLDSADPQSKRTSTAFTTMDSCQPKINNNNSNGGIGAGVNGVPGSTFRSNTPLLGGRHPLSRTSSLIDSIGIQRAASPFTSAKEPFIPQSSGVTGPSFWHGEHAESRVSTPVQQHPLLQRNESTSSFSYAANLGMNLSTHSLAVDITPLGTPTVAQSHASLFPSSDISPALDINGISHFPTQISIESSWKYIDTQGQTHGPFTTQLMSQWYIGGYFASTLQISRVGNTPETLGINDVFITLGELMTKLQKYDTDPFSTFDKVHAQSTNPDLISLNLAPYPNEVTAVTTDTIQATENDFFKPLTHENIWDMDGGTTTKEVDIKLGSVAAADQRNITPKSEHKSANAIEARRKEKAEAMAKALLEEQERRNQELKRKEEVQLLKKQRQKEEQELLKKLKEERELLKKQKERETLESERQRQVEKTNKAMQARAEVSKISKDLPSLNALKAKSIPWASKVKIDSPVETIVKNGVSSNETKKEESTNLQQRNIKEEKQKQESKFVLNWANKSSPPPDQTIDIKSQFQKNVKNVNVNVKETPSLKELEDPNFIEEQKKLWEKVQSSSRQIRSTNPASTPTTSWTTVTSKAKTAIGTVVSSSKANTGSNSSTTITTNTTPTASTFASLNSVSPRQEFIRWCKSQMKLNSGITNNNVLELLLSLPTGPESKELIQETIYANSDVMDGRRFATEFIRRRAECEKQGSDPLSWNEALALSGNDDDDWEFQVVSKKKGRKH